MEKIEEIMEYKSKHAVLIGAGELNANMALVIKNNLLENDFVIALDGGLRFCETYHIKSDMIVGDFDSLAQTSKDEFEEKEGSVEIAEEVLSRYAKDSIYRLPCEKDDTDTLAAIKMAIKKGFNRFTIYGGLGGRLSHTIANIQSLLYLKKQGLYGELVGNGSRIFLLKNESIELQPQSYHYISVFSYEEKAMGVSLKNLKYTVEDVELTNFFPIGVSNEFVGKAAEISVKQGVLLVVLEE